jgi:uncharacterized protein YecT (DUF1311 family)
MTDKKIIFFLPILALLSLAFCAGAQDCEKVKISDFPAKDLPLAADRVLAKTEPAYHYYYGIGVPVDYVKARHLAFIEMETEDDGGQAFEGSSVLIMIYANGFGVKRNLDLCIRMACANYIGAQAETEARVQHLKDIGSGASKKVFDLCDDISSGYMMGRCQSIDSEKRGIKRKSTVDSLIRDWPQKDRAAYERLYKAALSFFDKRSTLEVDLSGTARAVFELAESDSLEDHFKTEIFRAGHCSFTNYSSQDLIKADKELNILYSKIIHNKDSVWGSISREGVRITQRQWIRYRDAWVVFGAARCPGMSADSWKTLITKERIGQLRNFIDSYSVTR